MLTPKDAAEAVAQKAEGYYKGTLYEGALPDEDSVAYKNIYPNVDLLYTAANSRLKENIVLKAKPQSNVFVFDMQLEGLTLSTDENGQYVFLDNDGKAVFTQLPLYAVDANEMVSEDVSCEITQSETGYTVKVTMDEAYLSDAERAYPVYVDPTYMVTGGSVTFDTFIAKGSPGSNYNSGNNMLSLRTGKDTSYGVRRTLIKFTLPTGISGSSVSYVALRLKLTSYDGSLNVKGYRITKDWSSNEAKWNNFGEQGYDPNSGTSNFTHAGNNWYSTDVTTITKTWMNSQYPKYGFLLKDSNEGNVNVWATFASSDAASPNKPELNITYSTSGGGGSTPVPTTPTPTATPATVITFPLSYFYYNTNMEQSVVNQIDGWLTSANRGFLQVFNLKFTYSSKISSSTLNLTSACKKGRLVHCDDTCDGDCALHHKFASNFYSIGMSNSVRFVNYLLCNKRNGVHTSIGGQAKPSENKCIVSAVSSGSISRSLQHELSHLLGALDQSCYPDEPCVMRYDRAFVDEWCRNCSQRIWAKIASMR